ncbi:MAG: GTPase Era [Sulfurovaceae bacterium]
MDKNEDNKEATKCGFVAVVGRPNAGKSSLLNYLVGEKLAMVSKKAQATRKRMHIIVTHDATQIVFVDTPGIHKKEKLLNQFMLGEALKAMGDCDLIVFLAPANDSLEEYEKFLELQESKRAKHIVLLTKVDWLSNEELLKQLSMYQKYQDRFEAIIPFSIKKNIGKTQLLDEIVKYLEPSPWLYDDDMLTTEYMRSIYKEFIRESIFENISDEIPYESDVIIDKIDEQKDIDRIRATIIVEKDIQKRMIIGTGGISIKRIGKSARESIEKLSGKKCFLELFVTVKKGWSKNRDDLENFGYIID